MHDQAMMRGRSYLMKIGARTVTATISPIKHKINVNTLEHVATNQLELNEIGICGIELDRAIAFDPYRDESAYRRLHPDRSYDQQHGRRGDDSFRVAPVAEHSLADNRRRQARARAPETPAPLCAVVHGTLRRWQIDNRQSARKAALSRWGGTRICSTATTCGTGSTKILASRNPIASRTSAASPRWQN